MNDENSSGKESAPSPENPFSASAIAAAIVAASNGFITDEGYRVVASVAAPFVGAGVIMAWHEWRKKRAFKKFCKIIDDKIKDNERKLTQLKLPSEVRQELIRQNKELEQFKYEKQLKQVDIK